MKAILVIDIPTNDIKKYFVRYDLYHSGGINNMSELKISYFAELKPMPEKKDGDFVWVDIDTCDESYIHGWNDCIEEILGE